MMNTLDIEQLCAAAGFDVEPDGIRHPFKQADDDPADQSELLARFAALVLEEAAKVVDSAQPMGKIAATAAAIRAMKPVAT